MASLDVEIAAIVLFSAATFIVLFFAADGFFRTFAADVYADLSKKKRLDWMSRFSSTVHSILVLLLSTYVLTVDTQLREEPVWSNSSVATITLGIVSGYMIADALIIGCYYSYLGEVSFIYHHVLSAATCGMVLTYRAFEYFAVWRMLTELSTPFLNLRFYLDDAGKRSSKLYMVNGLLFTATFLSARILALPHYYYVLYTVHGTPGFWRAGKMAVMPYLSAFAMDAINIVWARKVVRGFLKGLSQRRAENGISAVEATSSLPTKSVKAN